MPGSEPCHCDETECENEDPGDGASRRRAKSGGQAVVTSDELGSGYSHVVQKDIVGELISNWLVTTLAALGFFLAMCGWTVCCADCSDPNVSQCMQHRARAGARQCVVDVDVMSECLRLPASSVTSAVNR